MANQLSEQEIQFRKRARRRLVGAIALVLLMVTVLPMVLDDREVKPTQQDIAITIPSQDGAEFSSRIVPVPPQAEPVIPASPPLASPIEKPQTPVEQAKKLESLPQKAVMPQEKSPEPVPSEASSKPDPAKPVAPAKGAFSLQVGVFSDTPKLKQLEGKLATAGFRPTREKLNTPKGIKIRLRAGIYPTRAEAEAAQARLKAAGHSGIVVANK